MRAVMVLLALWSGGCCLQRPLVFQSVPLRPQQTSMWCWAASGEMAMDFLGLDVTQCDQANRRFGRTDCCNTPTPAACVNGGWPEFPKYNFTSDITSNAALSWTAVKRQISCKKKPVAFSWHWDGGGGHMMILYGYANVLGLQFVGVNDPWAPNVGDQRVITYAAYVDGNGYSHWNDYYNITKR